MTVLVTGASGFLGAYLACSLKADGVIATGRNRESLARLEALGIRTIPIDLAQSIAKDVRDQLGKVEAIVHCAGLSSPWGRRADFEAGNITATETVIDLARKLRAKRLVYVSTASVYFQFRDQYNLLEAEVAPHFVNHYAATKYAAERRVLAADDLQPIVLRPRGIYGAGDTALLPRLIRVAQARPMPLFSPAGATDITHVEDVVEACRSALHANTDAANAVYNISGSVGLPLPEIITAACARMGINPRWRKLPFAPAMVAVKGIEALSRLLPHQPEPPVTAYALGILRYRQTLDLSRAASRLNWRPKVDFDEGLSRTFANGAMRRGPI